jgi:hypothetical protein
MPVGQPATNPNYVHYLFGYFYAMNPVGLLAAAVSAREVKKPAY